MPVCVRGVDQRRDTSLAHVLKSEFEKNSKYVFDHDFSFCQFDIFHNITKH